MADKIQLIILVVFAVLILLLAQLRELMRQIARTAEEWHRMIDTLRSPRRERRSNTDSCNSMDPGPIPLIGSEEGPEPDPE